MARNANVVKMKSQKFRKRRGGFRPLSEQSSLDATFIDPGLRKFWAQKSNPKSMGVSRAQAPEEFKGVVEYRGHMVSATLEARNPQKFEYLNHLFPGKFNISSEKYAAMAVEKRLREMVEKDQVPHEHVVLWKTTNTSMRMFFSPDRKRWYLVEQKHLLVRVSKTYVCRDSVMRRVKMNTIDWRTQHMFHLPSVDTHSPNSG